MFENISVKDLVESLHDGLYLVDKNRKIIYWNPAAEHITGFTAEEVVGKSCAYNLLTHVDKCGHNMCKGKCPLAATIADAKPRESEMYLHHKQGHRVLVSIRASVLAGAEGEIVGAVELFSDISGQEANRLKIKELEKMALIDALTKLANRHYIERELNARIEEKKRMGIPFGVCLMDIDHFKNFNDRHGHDVGDMILKFVANTFIAHARPFDLYGRWGGEEFIGVIRNISGEDLKKLSERMRLLIEHSYLMHEDRKLSITVSMGATIANGTDTIQNLVKRADELLYKSKDAGRNRLTMG